MRLPVAIAVAIGVAVLTPDPLHHSLAPARAEAAVALEMTLGDLLEISPLVVLATPIDHRSVWEEDELRGRRIVTYTRVRIDRALDGDAKVREEAWVRTFGGKVGSIGQRVEGEAVLVPGESSVLFLNARGDGTHAVAAMALGHYPVLKAEDGSLRLSPSPAGLLVFRKMGKTGTFARELLSGKTVDEAAALIAKARRNHAR